MSAPDALFCRIAQAAMFSHIRGICLQLYTRVGIGIPAATLDVLPGVGT
jgi:hypothetical protein